MNLLFFITADDHRDLSKKASEIIEKGTADTVEILNIHDVMVHIYRDGEYQSLYAPRSQFSKYSKFCGDTIEAEVARMMHLLEQEYRINPIFSTPNKDKSELKEMSEVLESAEFSRWLRNEACVWAGYGDRVDFVWLSEEGVNYDPMHPDNLTAYVIKQWRERMEDGLLTVEITPPIDSVRGKAADPKKEASKESLNGFNLIEEKELNEKLEDIRYFLNTTAPLTAESLDDIVKDLSFRMMLQDRDQLLPVKYFCDKTAMWYTGYLITSPLVVSNVAIFCDGEIPETLSVWARDNAGYGEMVVIRQPVESDLPGLKGYSEFPQTPEGYVFVNHTKLKVLNDGKKEAQG